MSKTQHDEMGGMQKGSGSEKYEETMPVLRGIT
jgi:hypothetical protein